MVEATGGISRPERRVDLEIATMLQTLTDTALVAVGLDPVVAESEVVELNAELPREHGVRLDPYTNMWRIYSIPEGRGGFNTTGLPSRELEEDNSRRWVLYRDRGTSFGSYYDYRGAVYAHGAFQPIHEAIALDEGYVSAVIQTIHDHHNHPIGVKF